MNIRLNWDKNKTINLCEHITINATEIKEEDTDFSCEYIEELEIICHKCDELFNLDILVN